MAISTKTFTTLVSNAAAAVQGAAAALVDFQPGSISLAYMRAVSAITLWLQALVLQVAALTRFATSVGPDADSWAADYGFKRLGATFATGPVTFARFTPTLQALIPAAVNSGTDANGNIIWTGGEITQTADGTQQFVVIPDTSQGAYNAALNAYVIAASVSSCTATVQALTAGTGGNVAAGLITVLGTSIVGVDTVTNASTFTGGNVAESDPAFKARFVQYLENLTEGTAAAVLNAALSIQVGSRAFLFQNVNYSGVAQPGYFYLVVDDGTGFPSDGYISAVYAAVDKVRAEGTMFGVFAPVVVTADIAMELAITAGYTGSTVRSQVQAALTTYTNSLSEGATLELLRLAQIAFDTTPGVANVILAGLTINGSAADLTVTGQQLVRAGTVTVS